MKLLIFISIALCLFINTLQAQTPHTPDATYTLKAANFEIEFSNFMQQNFRLGDIATVQKSGDKMVVKLYKEFAGFWWQHYGEGTRKEEQCNKGDLESFAECVQSKQGKLAIWKDREGNYHAE
jgi:hypothetical protein